MFKKKLKLLFLLIAVVLISCDQEDDTFKDSRCYIDDPVVEDGDCIRNKVVVISFDKFENSLNSEIIIENPDTTSVLVEKSFFERNNESIKDTATYICVWETPSSIPYVKKVCDIEYIDDKYRLIVKHAEYNEVIPDGKWQFAMTPYINQNENAYLEDGRINPNYCVDNEGVIHPVAIYIEPQDDGANGESQVSTNMDSWGVGLIEGLDNNGANVKFDSKLDFTIKADNLTKTIPISKGSWGSFSCKFGFTKLQLKIMEGLRFQFETSTEWESTGFLGIKYPSPTVNDFAIINYGDFGIDASVGVDLTLELKKGQKVPKTEEWYKEEAFEPDGNEEDDDEDEDYTFDDDGIDNADKIAGDINKANADASKDSEFFTLGKYGKKKDGDYDNLIYTFAKIPIYKGVFFVGPIPIYFEFSAEGEFRFYPPKVNANLHFGIDAGYHAAYYGGFAYAKDNKCYADLPVYGKVNFDPGWHTYSNSKTTQKYAKISANLNGSAQSKFGVFFNTKVTAFKVINANLAMGVYLRGTVNGALDFAGLDLLDTKTEAPQLSGFLGATVDVGVGGEIGAGLSAFGKSFGNFSAEMTLFTKPIWKGMYLSNPDTKYIGKLVNSNGDTKDLEVIIKDKKNWNQELFPENLNLYGSFLWTDKLTIDIQEFEIEGTIIPSVTITNISRDNIEAEYTNGDITYKIKNGGKFDYKNLSFDLEIYKNNNLLESYKFNTTAIKRPLIKN